MAFDFYRAFVGRSPYFKDWTKPIVAWGKDALGYNQMKNTQKSTSYQISYNDYLARANRQALRDWHKNVPGRKIKYPALSYAGQIRKYNTASARAMLDADTAYSNFAGNVLFKSAGLYNVGSRVYRWI